MDDVCVLTEQKHFSFSRKDQFQTSFSNYFFLHTSLELPQILMPNDYSLIHTDAGEDDNDGDGDTASQTIEKKPFT